MEKYEEFLTAKDGDLMEFIKRVLEGTTDHKEYQTISTKIPDRLATAIQKVVGFSVDDFGNEIDCGQTEHIWKEHGKYGRTDHSMEDISNFARLGYVVNYFDRIREGKNKSKYRNADGSLAKTIELQKKIGEHFYYVVEAVPDTKRKKLQVISAYINRNDTFFEMAVSNDPSRYVPDESQSNASFSKNIISNQNENTTG